LLGRFLEFSLPTEDIQASFNFYLKLGFSEAAVGETWPHPYAVVTDGRISLGLHQLPDIEPMLTFVKPELFKHLAPIGELGIELDFRHLGDDVFNEVRWAAPSGQRVRMIEARTFSPVERSTGEFTRAGFFQEIALPTQDLGASKAYWEDLGFVGMEEMDGSLPHITCTSDYIDLGLYAPADIRSASLRFEVEDVRATLAALREIGIEARSGLSAELKAAGAAMLIAPGGTPLILTPAT
jgi:catechol 2,3-dioxygenase-like lactoylglutathione lyase family enzyme